MLGVDLLIYADGIERTREEKRLVMTGLLANPNYEPHLLMPEFFIAPAEVSLEEAVEGDESIAPQGLPTDAVLDFSGVKWDVPDGGGEAAYAETMRLLGAMTDDTETVQDVGVPVNSPIVIEPDSREWT